ncbi:MAG: hypothetical protein ABIJ39_08585 [Chloroflexota bacterium]
MKISILDRILLLLTVLIAAFQIAVGIDGMSALQVFAYTVSFGVLLVACLLLIILGFEVLESPAVVIASTVIPLSLALGLAWEYLPGLRTTYLAFAVFGLLAIGITRLLPLHGRLPVLVLAIVHGIAGLTIFLLPISLSVSGQAQPGFSLVGVGGALIGIGGLLLYSLKTGRPILPQAVVLKALPILFLLMTAAFVAGFALS